MPPSRLSFHVHLQQYPLWLLSMPALLFRSIIPLQDALMGTNLLSGEKSVSFYQRAINGWECIWSVSTAWSLQCGCCVLYSLAAESCMQQQLSESMACHELLGNWCSPSTAPVTGDTFELGAVLLRWLVPDKPIGKVPIMPAGSCPAGPSFSTHLQLLLWNKAGCQPFRALSLGPGQGMLWVEWHLLLPIWLLRSMVLPFWPSCGHLYSRPWAVIGHVLETWLCFHGRHPLLGDAGRHFGRRRDQYVLLVEAPLSAEASELWLPEMRTAEWAQQAPVGRLAVFDLFPVRQQAALLEMEQPTWKLHCWWQI